MAKKNPSEPRTPATLENPGAIAGDRSAEELKRLSAQERASDRDENEILSMLQSERMGGGIIVLKRRTVTEPNFGHLAEMPAANFSEELVKQTFGGGEYQARALTGQRQFVTVFNFKIDFSIPAKYPGAERRDEKAQPALNVSELIREIKAAVQPAPTPPQDNALLIEMMKQNAAIMQAVISRPQEKPADMTAPFLAALEKMQGKLEHALEKISETKVPRDPLGDAIKNLEMLERLRDGSDKEEPSMMESFGRGLAAGAPAILGAFFGQPTPGAAGLPTLPASTPAPAASVLTDGEPTNETQIPTTPMNPALSMMVSQFRRAALEHARKNKDPVEFVDSLLSMVPESAHAQIYKLANAETWFADIFGAVQEATVYVKWLTDMRQTVLVRAFVVWAGANFKGNVAPESVAASAPETFSVSFQDELFNLTDPENWKESFEGSGIEENWLEKLRVALDKLLDQPAEPAAAQK